ncbi:MAG: hypothetical protein WC878_07280 [Candidatus Paceibacterota bacterium]|jgi:hypothetical protein
MNAETEELPKKWRFTVFIYSGKLTAQERRNKEKMGVGTWAECFVEISRIEEENLKNGYASGWGMVPVG